MKYKKEIFASFLLFIACIIWIYALFINNQITSLYSGASYRLTSNPITVNEFNRIVEKIREGKSSAKNIVGWLQKNDEKITDKRDISIRSDVIYAFGNIPHDLGVGAEYSCAFSSDKAYELWRSYDVEGKYVLIGNIRYKVSSVLYNMSDIIIVNALEVERNEDDFWSEGAFEYENFIESDIVINHTETTKILGFIASLPAYGVFLAVLCKLIFKIIKNRKSIVYIFVLSAIGIAWVFVNVKIFHLNFSVPESLIPAKWSNFGFWADKINNFKESMKDIAVMKVYYPDLYFKHMADKVLLYSAVSAVIFLLSPKMSGIETGNKLIAAELVIALILSLSLAVSYRNNIAVKIPVFYWMALPGYIFTDYVMDNLNIKYKAVKDVMQCLL